LRTTPSSLSFLPLPSTLPPPLFFDLAFPSCWKGRVVVVEGGVSSPCRFPSISKLLLLLLGEVTLRGVGFSFFFCALFSLSFLPGLGPDHEFILFFLPFGVGVPFLGLIFFFSSTPPSPAIDLVCRKERWKMREVGIVAVDVLSFFFPSAVSKFPPSFLSLHAAFPVRKTRRPFFPLFYLPPPPFPFSLPAPEAQKRWKRAGGQAASGLSFFPLPPHSWVFLFFLSVPSPTIERSGEARDLRSFLSDLPLLLLHELLEDG